MVQDWRWIGMVLIIESCQIGCKEEAVFECIASIWNLFSLYSVEINFTEAGVVKLRLCPGRGCKLTSLRSAAS